MRLFSRSIGNHHESQAEQYLNGQGLVTLQRNFSCRGGEIDLIMRDGDTLVFVEVRFRRNNSHGAAIESVTTGKQQKLLHAARYFLSRHPQYQKMPCRFDVFGVDAQPTEPHNNAATSITWLKNAFTE